MNTMLIKSTLFGISLLLVSAAVSRPMTTPPPPANGKPPVIIGYVGGFRGLADIENVAANKLTHINYAFVNVVNNRAVLTNEQTDTVNFRKLKALKVQNPDLKILISLGGWTWSGNFSDAVRSDTARRAFAASAVDIIRKHSLDGVDIDWEYPGRPGYEGNVYRPEDKENFTTMFAELRKELDALERETGEEKLLTTAVGAFSSFLESTEMGRAERYLDFVNLMTYDYSGRTAGHHTNLFASDKANSTNSADKAVQEFVAAGVPVEKLVMGIAFYGRKYKLPDDAAQGLGDSVVSRLSGGGFTLLKDSVENQQGYKKYRDTRAKAPYIYNKETQEFITYDDEWSVRNKCNYVKKHGMAGVMFWEYSSDPKEYLLDEINAALR